MNIELCKAEITRHEGKVLEIYEDSLGYKTLGIGHLCQPEAFYNLPSDIQRVLVNMCFNLGGTRLSKFKNMLTACRAHDWNEMARQMEDSRWFGQVGRRSKELQELVLQQNDSVY
jgi:GH24 family phage-related lysozyme (muramidase)